MTAEGDLIKLMQEDASFQPEDKMGKIGAVATDIAEVDVEIQKLKEELKHLEVLGVKYISSEDDYHRFEINTSDPSIINLLRKKYYFEEVNNETH